MVAEVAGEGGHVVGGVGEAEDVVADEVGGSAVAEAAVVGVGGDDGELFERCTRFSVRALSLSGAQRSRGTWSSSWLRLTALGPRRRNAEMLASPGSLPFHSSSVAVLEEQQGNLVSIAGLRNDGCEMIVRTSVGLAMSRKPRA